MSKLTEWLDHRMDVVGLERWKDLLDCSGVSAHAMEELRASGSLGELNRSERRWLAAALRVSLRKLEQLDAGDIDWIEDQELYDVDTPGRPAPWQESDPTYWAPKEVELELEDRGTPLIGSIRASGNAETDEDWQQEWGRCLSLRYGKGKDIYALELDRSGQSVVFRNIPPWEFREGEAAVYCWNGWESQGWFGRVYLQASRARVVTADGERHDLDPVNIVRIVRVIGRWPKE